MQAVILTIIFFIIIGGVGMYFGNRKVDRAVAKQRWVKYAMYILITSTVVLSIWFRFFPILAAGIILIGYFELLYAKKKLWIAILIYSVIAAGFCVFAFKIINQFQFFIYLQVLALDAFSQVTGQLIGKSLLVPKISPSKTVEGLLGGVFFCVLAAVLQSKWMDISISAAICLGLFTAITGFAGDLLASFYKRVIGVKDYSNLLPGQGGFLDRFDSFMMTSFCYSIVYLIVKNMSFGF